MSNNIEEQLASMRSSLRRQRLFNLALVGIAIAAVTVAATRPVGDATFNTVTCTSWKLVDNEGKERISASTLADGSAGMKWVDNEGIVRITAFTMAGGSASIIMADKDGKVRIGAGTNPDGTVKLPTKDLKPKP